jgi:general secretion pathway protein J
MKNSRAQSGFTLIEVMLALALTGMLLGLLSAGVYIVAEDWNRNSDRLDANLDDAVAILQIDRALQGAFPHSYTNEDTLSRQIYFTGEDDFVSWVSSVSPQRTPGLTSWELFNVDAEGVYLALAPAYSDNPSERLSLSVPRLILPGYSAQFSYLYEELNESKRWRNDWEAEEFLGLPLAVYVRFEPADRDREVLEIVARIRNNSHRSIRPNTGLQQGL